MRLLKAFFDPLNVNIHIFSMFHCRYANVPDYRIFPLLFGVSRNLVICTPMTFPKYKNCEFPKHLDPTGFR